jgi:hypothetical protein
MALYFLGQVASPNSLFMADAVRGGFYFGSKCITFFILFWVKKQQKQPKNKAKRR